MSKTIACVMTWMGSALLLLGGISACSSELEEPLDELAEQESSALISVGGLNADGDACEITGGPNKGKTGTRHGKYCCTKPGGEGHCQDCTTPSDWCKTKTKLRRPIGVFTPDTIGSFSRAPR